MGFRKGAYAQVWSVEPGKGNFTKVRLSISRKKKDSDEFEQEFSGFCTFFSSAHAKADKLKERSRIQLGDVDVTNNYDKETKKEYTTYKVFDFELQEQKAAQTVKKADNLIDSNPVESDDDCPF